MPMLLGDSPAALDYGTRKWQNGFFWGALWGGLVANIVWWWLG